MKHAREDYNRIQDPENKIGADEPVMLFRAHDKHFIDVLNYYRCILTEAGNYEMVKAVENHIDLAIDWRAKNGCKEPDM